MKWDFWLKRGRWERQMDAELQFHLNSQISDYVSQGLSPEEAELRARREFGALELARDECRDHKPLERLEHFWHDLRYACRSLRKAPGVAGGGVLSLPFWIAAKIA